MTNSQDKRRPTRIGAAVAVALFVTLLGGFLLLLPVLRQYYWPAGNGLDISGYQIGRDFINVWAGPRLAWSGHVDELFNLDVYARAIRELFGANIPFHNWSYPPTALILYWPFSELAYFAALVVWTVTGVTAFLCAALMDVRKDARWRAGLAIVFAPACLINLISGQNGFFTAALMLAAFQRFERRPILAGVLLGLLSFKPQLGLVVPFVLIAVGAWRTIASAVVTTLALVLASMIAFGSVPWRDFLTAGSQFQTHLLVAFHGFDTHMMSSVFAGVRTFGGGAPLAWSVQAFISLVTLIFAVWAFVRAKGPALRTQIIIAAAPLVTPYAFDYDLTAWSAIIVWRLIKSNDLGPFAMLGCLAALISPMIGFYLSAYGIGLAPFMLLGVFAASVWESLAPQTTPRGGAIDRPSPIAA